MRTQKNAPGERRTTVALATAVLFGGLIVSGYSAEADAPRPARFAAETAVLETSAGRYVFTPSTCAIYNADGFDDIEIQGPGTAPDGEKIFFELSSTANAMTIGLGVDRPFASPQRQLKAGRFESQEFTIVTSGRQLSVASLKLVDENGTSVDDHAALSIDCGVQ